MSDGDWCHRCGNDTRLMYDHDGEVLCEVCYEPHRRLQEVEAERDGAREKDRPMERLLRCLLGVESMSSDDEGVATASTLREALNAGGDPPKQGDKVVARTAIEALEQREEEVEHYKACASSWCKQYDSMVKHARGVEADRERLRAALHEHAVHAIPEHDTGRYYRCNVCMSKAWKKENIDHDEDCLLRGYEAEGEGS